MSGDAVQNVPGLVVLTFVICFSTALIIFRRRASRPARWLRRHRLFLHQFVLFRNREGRIVTDATMSRALVLYATAGYVEAVGLLILLLMPRCVVPVFPIMLLSALVMMVLAELAATRRYSDEDVDVDYDLDYSYRDRDRNRAFNEDGPERL